MIEVPMYPLRLEPIYQYRLWGGRRLAELLTAPLPGNGRTEATEDIRADVSPGSPGTPFFQPAL